MSESVVVAVDGSPQTGRVLDAAADYAKRVDLPVTIIHVRELEAVGKGGAVWNEDRAETAEIAARAVEYLKGKGVVAEPVTAACGAGHVAKAIVDIAKEREAQVIVIGTRGHTQIAGLLLGSTATKLLHLIDRPLLVIP
jgi:nucleotide-binding universal stress UspA family protein